MPRFRRRRWLRAAALGPFALFAIALGFGLAGFAPVDWLTSQFFYPTAEHVRSPDDTEEPYEILWIDAEEQGRLEAWWFPAAETSAGVVLQVHGNAGNLSHHWGLASGLTGHGFDVLCFDYRAFGRSEGKGASRRTTLSDLRAALAFTRGRAAERDLPFFVLGQSIGAALALEAFGADPETGATALAVDAPFASWPGIAAYHLSGGGGLLEKPLRLAFGRFFRRAGIDPVDAARRLGDLPVLVIAGEDDEICPPFMAREVQEAAGPTARLLMLDGAPHVGLREDEVRADTLAAVADFFHDSAAATAAP